MTTMTARRRTTATAATAGALALTLALLLTACGSGASTAPSTGGSDSSTSQGPRTPPGVNGRIAAVTGTTLQVQSATAQTAVSYTATTPITKDAAATITDITTGLCATVRPATGDTTATATALTAATIALSAPVNGACPSRITGGGQRGSSASATTSAQPGGAAGFGANGLVAAVHGATFTISSTTSAPSTEVTVTTNSGSTITKARPGTPADLVVGACVNALGPPDTTGAVAATALTVRPQVNGTCGGGGRGGQGQGQRTTSGA